MYSMEKEEFGCEKQGLAFEEEKETLESEQKVRRKMQMNALIIFK